MGTKVIVGIVATMGTKVIVGIVSTMEAAINIIFQRFSSLYCRNNYFDTTSAFDTIVAVRVRVLQVRSSFESFLSMKQPSDVTARNMARRTHLVFVCSPNRTHVQCRLKCSRVISVTRIMFPVHLYGIFFFCYL
jgi:hypothetical protein